MFGIIRFLFFLVLSWHCLPLQGFTIGALATFTLNGSNAAPQVAVDGSGNTFFIWVNSFPNFPTFVEVVRFDATTLAFSTPIAIGTWVNTSLLNNLGGFPQISTNVDGNAAAIWINGATMQIDTALFNVNTLTWSLPFRISNAPSTNVTPQIAIDSAGNAIAVWNQLLPTQSLILASIFTQALGTWTAPILLSTLGTVPQVSVNADGAGFVTWQTFLTLNPSQIQAIPIQIP